MCEGGRSAFLAGAMESITLYSFAQFSLFTGAAAESSRREQWTLGHSCFGPTRTGEELGTFLNNRTLCTIL